MVSVTYICIRYYQTSLLKGMPQLEASPVTVRAKKIIRTVDGLTKRSGCFNSTSPMGFVCHADSHLGSNLLIVFIVLYTP